MDFNKYVNGDALNLGSITIDISELVGFLRSNTYIKKLSLFGSGINAEGAKALADFKNLTELDLRNNNIGDKGAKELAKLENLTSLHLQWNKIGDEGAKELANLKNLTSLNLGQNKIGAEGAIALANGKLENLTKLYLSDNKIGAEGAKELANGKFIRLTSLDLSHNNIGAEGLKALADSTHLRNLKNLHLGYIEAGGEDIKALVKIKNSGININFSLNNSGADIFYRFLLNAHSNNQIVDEEEIKKMVFSIAQHDNNGKIVEYILMQPDKYPFLIDSQDEGGKILLCLAAEMKNIKLVSTLLEKGANVNAKDEQERTPLHWAAQSGHTVIVNALLKAKANVNATDEQERTPLHRAASREVVNALMDRGADINAKDEQERAPLHRAAENGHTDVINALLDRGADINAKDGYGATPLYWAAKFGRKNATEVLIQKILIQDFSVQKPNLLKYASFTYWNKCKNKIEGKIGNSNTSYLDLLKADENKIVICFVNDEFEKTINELNYKGEFSIIESQIRNKFNKGVERRELIDDGTGVIQRLDNDRNLPPEISEKIAFYLPNSDLKKLKDIGDNDKNAHVKPSTKMDETREEQGITGNGRKV